MNHDVLMGKLARRVGDKRVLRVIRRYPAGRDDGARGGAGEVGRDAPGGSVIPPCSAISFWMSWIRNWNGEGIDSAGTRMMGISM